MKRYTLLAAAGAVLFAAAPVQAADFLVRCSSGSVRTCASFQVLTTHPATGGTQVVIKVRNENARGSNGSNWGQLITRFALLAPENLGTVTMGAVTVEGGASTTGSPASRWAMGRSNTNNLGQQFGNDIEFAASTQNNEGGIKGCVRPNANPGNFYTTCSGGAPTGWVAFSFTTSAVWNAADARLSWHAQSIGDGNPNNGQEGDLSIQSATGAPDAPPPPPPPPTEVVPEPATIILLGTGLAGIAAASRRKKKVADKASA